MPFLSLTLRARCLALLFVLAGLSMAMPAQAVDLYDLQPCPHAIDPKDEAAPTQQPRWDITLSPYTYHWSYSVEHKHVILGAIDRYLPDKRFCGIALFKNSFGQPSAYVYAGKRWDGILGEPRLFLKVSAGLIYGYKGEFKDKIPFNEYGIAPAIIPALGYRFNEHDSAQLMVLGNAAIMFAFGHTF